MKDARSLGCALSNCVLITPADEPAEHLALCAAITDDFRECVFRALTPEHFANARHRRQFIFLRDRWSNRIDTQDGTLHHGLTPVPLDVPVVAVLERLRQVAHQRSLWKLARAILEGVLYDDTEGAEDKIREFVAATPHQLASQGSGW